MCAAVEKIAGLSNSEYQNHMFSPQNRVARVALGQAAGCRRNDEVHTKVNAQPLKHAAILCIYTPCAVTSFPFSHHPVTLHFCMLF